MTFRYQVFYVYLEIRSTSFCNVHCFLQGFLRHRAGKPSLWKGAIASLLALPAKTSSLVYLKGDVPWPGGAVQCHQALTTCLQKAICHIFNGKRDPAL